MSLIVSKNRISENELSKIKELEEICRSFDNTKSSISLAHELNFHKDMNSLFLLYEGKRLIGILAVFAPVKGEAEISALISPDERNKGHFKSLLIRAAEELEKFGITIVYFVHDSKSISGHNMISRWDLPPSHSEYLLVFNKKHSFDTTETNITVKETTMQDLNEITSVSLDIFGGDKEEWVSLHKKSLSNDNVICFSAYSGKTLIGTGNVNITPQGLFIFCFGIAPGYRRQGFGRAFLYSIISRLKKTYPHEILLEVDNENTNAYNLYTTNGFSEKARFDYYKCRLPDIRQSHYHI